MRTATNGLHLSDSTRSRLQRDVEEIKRTLGSVATKEDVRHAVKPLEGKIDKLLKVLAWPRERSEGA